MTEMADLEDWARRYLDLWEDQVTALAADRDFSKLLLAQLSAFNAFPAFSNAAKAEAPDPATLAAAMSSWRSAMATAMACAAGVDSAAGKHGGVSKDRDHDGDRKRDGGRATGVESKAGADGDPTGAASPAVSPQSQQLDLDVIARRLADLEARVAGLETTRERLAPGRPPRGAGGSRRRSAP